MVEWVLLNVEVQIFEFKLFHCQIIIRAIKMWQLAIGWYNKRPIVISLSILIFPRTEIHNNHRPPRKDNRKYLILMRNLSNRIPINYGQRANKKL